MVIDVNAPALVVFGPTASALSPSVFGTRPTDTIRAVGIEFSAPAVLVRKAIGDAFFLP